MNLDKCRSEVAGDVISGLAVGMGICTTFVESGVNSGRIIWQARPVLPTTFVQYLIAFYSRPEATSDAISSSNAGQVDMDVCVKFDASRSNRSRDIRLPHFVTSDDVPSGVLPKIHLVQYFILDGIVTFNWSSRQFSSDSVVKETRSSVIRPLDNPTYRA